MLIVFLFLALILFIWLTVKPNSLRKFYSQISEKHDQTSISVEGVLLNQKNVKILFCNIFLIGHCHSCKSLFKTEVPYIETKF